MFIPEYNNVKIKFGKKIWESTIFYDKLIYTRVYRKGHPLEGFYQAKKILSSKKSQNICIVERNNSICLTSIHPIGRTRIFNILVTDYKSAPVTHPDQGFFRNYLPFTGGHACTTNPFAPGKYLPRKIFGTMLCPIDCHKLMALWPTLWGHHGSSWGSSSWGSHLDL